MFVSSYSTYIQTSSSEKNTKEKLENARDSYSRYETKDSLINAKIAQVVPAATQKLPLDYISNYKVLNNQQKLQKDSEPITQEKNKFTKILTLSNAQEAYIQNSMHFVLSKKPKPALDQTPSHDKETENVLKYKMISTYIANENYYRATA